MSNNFFEINTLISDWIKENKSFSIVRIDNTVGHVLSFQDMGARPFESIWNPSVLVEAGIYPPTMEYAYQNVLPKVLDAALKSDILGFVDVGEELRHNHRFLEKFKDKPVFFTGDSYHVLDPGCLLLGAKFGKPEEPWTKNLKDKKVLVISPHYESILRQWEKIDLVWGENKNNIVPFELVDCIRAPLHPLLDDRQYPNCNSWEDTVEYIKAKIQTYDYDILLSAVSQQSALYANFAKENGKVGIQTGGILQLFFGIKGNRWMNHEIYFGWHEMMNEHWIYPLQIDEPQRKNQYSSLETNYAYWR